MIYWIVLLFKCRHCSFVLRLYLLSIPSTTYGMTGGVQDTRLRETVYSTCPAVKPDLRDCLTKYFLLCGDLDGALCLLRNVEFL